MEYDPEDFHLLLKPFKEVNAKVVYGSRIRKQKSNSKRLLLKGKHPNSQLCAYLGGMTVTFFTNLLFGSKITDEPTCYKCFKTNLIKTVPIKYNDFAWEPEITAKILKMKIRIYEVPISYHPRRVIEGKKINWKDGVKALATLLECKLK